MHYIYVYIYVCIPAITLPYILFLFLQAVSFAGMESNQLQNKKIEPEFSHWEREKKNRFSHPKQPKILQDPKKKTHHSLQTANHIQKHTTKSQLAHCFFLGGGGGAPWDQESMSVTGFNFSSLARAKIPSTTDSRAWRPGKSRSLRLHISSISSFLKQLEAVTCLEAKILY